MSADERGAARVKKAWWRRKRWWVVGALWLFGLWAASAGPAAWAVNRGWISDGAYVTCFRPVIRLMRESPAGGVYGDYLFRWTSIPAGHKAEWDAAWMPRDEAAEDAAIDRTHWTPPAEGDGIDRTKWVPEAGP